MKLSRNFIFRRILQLVVASVLLTALLTGLVFYFVSQNLLIDRAKYNLLPTTQGLAGMVSQELKSDPNKSEFIFPTSVLNGRPYAFLRDGRQIRFSEATVTTKTKAFPPQGLVQESRMYVWPMATITGPEKDSEITRTLRTKYLDSVVKGNHYAELDGDDIIAGVPLYNADTGVAIGAVFITQSVTDTLQLRNTLYRVLFGIMALISASMVAIALFASRTITKPVNAMRSVALEMARGDFDIRADEDKPGELGELAASLNTLSSALSQTIDELKLERNRLRHVLDGLHEGIVAVGGDGAITQVNPAIERIFGDFDPSGLRDGYIQDEELWADFDAVIAESCTVARLMHVDRRILRVTITPLDATDGVTEGAVGLFRDVTESERLEQTRRDYVANVSHELRTPVSSIRSLAETLKDGMISADEDRNRYYGYMVHESMRLSRLIDDLLELSRLQSGNIALKKRAVDVKELLYDVQERYAILAENNGVAFHLAGEREVPDAYTNGDRAEQVLVILLDNALKFTRPGGHITLQAIWDAEKVSLCVADDGIGIAPEDLPHIFDRFYKADKAHTGNGTGLGLSIAKELLSLMGEEIRADSVPGNFTRFTFTLQRYDAHVAGEGE